MATELPHQPLRSFTYYETVERDEPEPLPSELNTVSKHHALQASKDKLEVRYVGKGNHSHDVGAIRADRPCPQRRVLYYFEVTVLDAGTGEKRLPAGAVEEFLRARFEEPETLLLVAEREGAEPGLCLTGAWQEPLSRLSYAAVLALHVDPSMRHRGIARALVARAVEVLLERGVERLGARVEHNDDARISMGERWGWTRAWEWMDSGPRA